MIYLSKGGAGADSDHTWIRPCFRPKKKKELCLSFLKVKTLSAMRFFFFFFFFLVKKGYADAEIPPNFFLLHFSATIFFSRPLRGRFLTFFFH